MKFRWLIGSKTTNKNVLIETQTPIKENAVNCEHSDADTSFKPQSSAVVSHVTSSFQDSSSKEEIFLDSQPWLESDCEDFFSVNGDLTPSLLGNTPIHESSFIETHKVDRSLHLCKTPDSELDPPPTDKKQTLVELFRESFVSNPVNGDQHTDGIMANGKSEAKPAIFGLPPKSAIRSRYSSMEHSFCSGERTPCRDDKPEKGKASHHVQCCLPSLVRSLSFSERKKRLSPAHSSAGECSKYFLC